MSQLNNVKQLVDTVWSLLPELRTCINSDLVERLKERLEMYSIEEKKLREILMSLSELAETQDEVHTDDLIKNVNNLEDKANHKMKFILCELAKQRLEILRQSYIDWTKKPIIKNLDDVADLSKKMRELCVSGSEEPFFHMLDEADTLLRAMRNAAELIEELPADDTEFFHPNDRHNDARTSLWELITLLSGAVTLFDARVRIRL